MTCPCSRLIALLDSAERIFKSMERHGAAPGGVAERWLIERAKLCATCPRPDLAPVLAASRAEGRP
jgi:hypothetical protein